MTRAAAFASRVRARFVAARVPWRPVQAALLQRSAWSVRVQRAGDVVRHAATRVSRRIRAILPCRIVMLAASTPRPVHAERVAGGFRTTERLVERITTRQLHTLRLAGATPVPAPPGAAARLAPAAAPAVFSRSPLVVVTHRPAAAPGATDARRERESPSVREADALARVRVAPPTAASRSADDAIEIARIADQVLHTLDRRVIAARERQGRC